MSKKLNLLAAEIHENNKVKGFYDEPKNIGEMLSLLHSEVSEALEADRKNKYCSSENLVKYLKYVELDISLGELNKAYEHLIKGTFEEEMADIIIRVLDMCAFKNIDIEGHIKAKLKYNTTRPHKHGKAY